MSAALVTRIKKLVASARGNRLPLPFGDIDQVFTLSWLEPDPKVFKKFDELDDVKDEIAGWLPLGKADGQCVMVDGMAPHRVAVFMEELWPLAPSLDEFFSKVLLAKGEKSPGQKLRAAVDKANDKLEADKPKDAKAILEPLLRDFETPSPSANDPDVLEELDDLVSEAWHLLGVAEHGVGDDARSLAAYEHAMAWNRNALSGANILLIHLDAKRYDDAIKLGAALVKELSRKVPIDEEIDLRARLLMAQLLGKKKAAGLKALAEWSKKASPKDRAAMKKVLATDFPDYGLSAELADAKKAIG